MGAVFMLIIRVLGVEKLFDSYNGKSDGDPISSRIDFAMRKVDAIIDKPSLDKVEGLVLWLEKVMDLLLSQMLAVARVGRVGNWSELGRSGFGFL